MLNRRSFLIALAGVVAVCYAENEAPTSDPSSAPVLAETHDAHQDAVAPPKHPQIVAHDIPTEGLDQKVIRVDEPSLGLHGITEQQLNLKYYNFICSSHYHLDCKLTETLQVCMKDNYVAVTGLPLSFERGSSDLRILTKWMRKCDRNDQDLNQEAMRVIRKQIHYQNENDWKDVFNGATTFNFVLSALFAIGASIFLL